MNPSGSKLVTAGQDGAGAGLLIVWDIEFVTDITLSNESSAPDINFGPMARIPHTSTKIIIYFQSADDAFLMNFTGSINCVRWSKKSEGRRLACAGDDPVLCIYECTGVYSSMGSINQPTTSANSSNIVKRNVESYRCTHKLLVV